MEKAKSEVEKLLFIRKICYTCIHFKRNNRINSVNCMCDEFNTKVPLFAYCPRWEGNGRVLKLSLLKNYTLEK